RHAKIERACGQVAALLPLMKPSDYESLCGAMARGTRNSPRLISLLGAECHHLTWMTLRLNDRDCREARGRYAMEYWTGEISYSFLARRAPFIAMELSRQGGLRPWDA